MKDLAQKQKQPIKGEVAVWFSSLGLALGLVMIAGLLGVIIYEGLSVFWPNRVMQLTLNETGAANFNNRTEIAGELQYRQERIGHEADADGKVAEELQLFVGNRDHFGFSYKFINVDDIVSESMPEGLMQMERLEYGDALVYPVSVTLESGETIVAAAPEFRKVLQGLVDECADRRELINQIESEEIGKLNKQLESLRLQELKIHRKHDLSEDDQRKLEEIEIQRKALQVNYEDKASRSRELRAINQASVFHYRLASGESGNQPVGTIIRFYFPNELGFFGRVGLFFGHIWEFLSEEPREANTEGGVFPAIFGTFVMTLIMSIAVTPFGVVAAIYLREYAKDGFMVRSVRVAVNNLAGVPSIVFGVFGLGFFVYFVGGTIDQLFFSLRLPSPTFGTGGILWASLTLALMTVPVVIVATEEALAAVSRGVRESSLACGASKWQTIQRVVLPASAPGILTGMILAMARGAGEVAPLMLVGVVKLAPTLPLDTNFPFMHFERKFMHLGFHIYDLGFQSPDSEAAKPMVFATTLLLILLVVILNLGAILVRNHLRKKFKTSAF